MKQLFQISLLLFVMTFFSSCWTQKMVNVVVEEPHVIGNEFDAYIGKSQREIMQSLSAPRRIISDGADGNVLVYENFNMATNTSTRTISRSSSTAQATSGYSYTGTIKTNASGYTTQVVGQDGQSVTREEKTYVNFFMDANAICYQVKTNIGDIYSEKVTQKECRKVVNEKGYHAAFILAVIPITTLFAVWPLLWYASHGNDMLPCEQE